MIVFDIETGPLPDDVLRPIFDRDYTPPAHPGEFDPSAVKYGNLKDPAKRAAKLTEAESDHAAAVADHATNVERDRQTKWAEFVDNAALDATTGRILAIGFRNGTGQAGITSGDEPDVLAAFWARYTKCRAKQERLVGCNSFEFDLPFIFRRSLILGIEIPGSFRSGRYFDPIFSDLRDVWLCGQRGGNGGICSSLDAISRALGFRGKSSPDAAVTGATFAKFWNGSAADRELATQYLLHDLELTAAVAARMGFI